MKSNLLLATIAYFLLPGILGAQEIRLHSVTAARDNGADSGYTLDGIRMQDYSRAKLLNQANFGESGIYPKYISITDTYQSAGSLEEITANDEIDLFFFGVFNKLEFGFTQFTQGELDSLHEWSSKGGKLIIGGSPSLLGAGYDNRNLDEIWGFGIETPGLSEVVDIYPTEEGASSFLFDGPFGMVPMAHQGGALQGYFVTTPENSIVLGMDAENRPTLVLDCATLDLIISDCDAYTDLSGLSYGSDIENDNDRFWLNAIAYMDQLQGPPVIAQEGSLLSTGSYLSYQWSLDGQPIVGATDSTLAITENGLYSVEVSMSCGCNAISQPVAATTSGVVDSQPDMDWSVLPNPTTDLVRVQLVATQPADFLLFIYDATGREVLRKRFDKTAKVNTSLHLRDLAPGVYSVVVNADGERAAKKLVVRR